MNSTAEKAGELRVALARAGWRRAEARVDDPWTLRARGQAEDPTDGFEASLLVEWGLALDLGPDPRHVVEAEVASARVGEPFTLAPLPPADLRQDGRRPPQVVLDEIPTSLRPAEPSVVWLLKNASSWSVAGSDQRFAVRAHLKQWCPRPFAEHLSALFVAHAGRSRLGAPVRPSRAVGVTADPSFELDDALAALRQASEAYSGVVERVGDEAAARVSLAGHLDGELTGSVRVAPDAAVTAHLDLPPGAAALSLAPQRGLTGFLRSFQECKVGERALDDLFLIHTDDEGAALTRKMTATLKRMAGHGLQLAVAEDRLAATLRPAPGDVEAALDDVLLLWRQLARELAGLRL